MSSFGKSFLDMYFQGSNNAQNYVQMDDRKQELERALAFKMAQMAQAKADSDRQYQLDKAKFDWTKEYQEGVLNAKETPKPVEQLLEDGKFDPKTHSYFDYYGYPAGVNGPNAIITSKKHAGDLYEPKSMDNKKGDGGLDDSTAKLLGELSNPSKYMNTFGVYVKKDPQLISQDVSQKYDNIKARLLNNRSFKFLNGIETMWGKKLTPSELNDEINKHYQSGNLNKESASNLLKFLPYYEQIYNGIK